MVCATVLPPQRYALMWKRRAGTQQISAGDGHFLLARGDGVLVCSVCGIQCAVDTDTVVVVLAVSVVAFVCTLSHPIGLGWLGHASSPKAN